MLRRTFLGCLAASLTALFTRRVPASIKQPVTSVPSVAGCLPIRDPVAGDYYTVTPGFKKFLMCQVCGFSAPMLEFMSAFDPAYPFTISVQHAARDDSRKTTLQSGMVTIYGGFCPTCNRAQHFEWCIKEQETDPTFWKITIFNPAEVLKVRDDATGKKSYVWHIPKQLTDRVLAGDLYLHAKLPGSVITAIVNHRFFRFNPGVLHYCPVVTGIPFLP